MRLICLCFLALAVLMGATVITPAAKAEPYVYQGGNVEESSSPGKLFVGNGEEVHKLPFYGSSPSLAPDGKRIVFQSETLGKEGLAITDLDGHGPHVILPPSVELLDSYEWAADGSEVVASTIANGTIVSLHPRSTSWEWEVKTILPWKGRAYEPTISPDGSKIAFVSFYDATGKELGNPAIFIANRNGSEVEQLTSPPAYAGHTPSFSPDSKSIAFQGSGEGESYADIYSIDLETKEISDLTNTPSTGEWNPDFLSSARVAYANSTGFNLMDANGENQEAIRTFAGKEVSYGASWPQVQGDLPTMGPETKEEATELLLRYAPKMRYHTIESFYAMSWHPITEIYFKKSTKESNRLIRSATEKSEVIAYANPALSSPYLNWEFLKPVGGKYPNEKLVSSGDRLSE